MSYSVTQVEAMCCVTGWSANIEHHSIHPGQVPRAIRAMETEGSGIGTPERREWLEHRGSIGDRSLG